MTPQKPQDLIRDKMVNEGCNGPIIESFINSVKKVQNGVTGLISDTDISGNIEIPSLESISVEGYSSKAPLESLAVIKLNGGLGTGMGLDKAKSLLPIKGHDCFLDFIARQILHLRQVSRTKFPRFLLMNSFSTQEDSLRYLNKYPELKNAGQLDFLQNKVPKISAETLTPAEYRQNRELEWCPPGHGDIYPSMVASGIIDELLTQGIRYLFVSNSDNLGATVDLDILGYFADSGLSFLMEVASRTSSDKKGGHLAKRKDGRLILREKAQCPPEESDSFQNIEKYKYFNTNSVWIFLPDLKEALEKNGGFLELPLIRNHKTINPKEASSEAVYQLESAMGAAIECFDKSNALLVPRSRFAPVKTTNDLLSIKSDAYQVSSDYTLKLAPQRNGIPPEIKLDERFYKKVDDFDRLIPGSPPSLIDCETFQVTGPVKMDESSKMSGVVTIHSRDNSVCPALLSPGEYSNGEFEI